MLLAPTLEKVAREYAGRVTFRRLDAGWMARTRRTYGFHGVPTLIFYSRGGEVARLVGLPAGDAPAALRRFVERGLAAGG
jgi:thioredoxin-like negative regulator of GroEL